MNKKKLSVTLCGCAAVYAFNGCASTQNDDMRVQKNNLSSSDETALEIVKNENLVINAQKCIGCGKCVRSAPQNFTMNTEIRKAEVISQEIASQTVIDRAVAQCPTQAITQ